MAKRSKNNIRKVKVYGKRHPSKNVWSFKEKEVPWLNVSGVWLERAGFSIGDVISIEVDKEKIKSPEATKERQGEAVKPKEVNVNGTIYRENE